MDSFGFLIFDLTCLVMFIPIILVLIQNIIFNYRNGINNLYSLSMFLLSLSIIIFCFLHLIIFIF